MNARTISRCVAGCMFFFMGADLPSQDAPAKKDASVPPEVEVCKPVVREISDSWDVAGRIEAAQTVMVRPRVSGAIVKVYVKEGSTVKKGDLLFEIDSRALQAESDHARAEVALAEAKMNLAKVLLERAKASARGGAVGENELLHTEADFAVGKATVEAERAKFNLAQLNLELTKIISPIDGTIGRFYVDPANPVQADVTVLTGIMSTDPTYAAFDVNLTTALKLRQLQRKEKPDPKANDFPIEVSLNDSEGNSHRGRLTLMNSYVDPSNNTVGCRAVFPNTKDSALLMPGMIVSLHLKSDPHKALLLPQTAIGSFGSGGAKADVYLVNDKGVIESRQVVLGPYHDDDFHEVAKGLKDGDRVVVKANGVEAGKTVRPKLVDFAPAKSKVDKKP